MSDLILQGENVFQLAVVALRPEVIARLRFDKLGGDAHAVASFPHAPFDQILHTKLTTNLLNLERLSLVTE